MSVVDYRRLIEPTSDESVVGVLRIASEFDALGDPDAGGDLGRRENVQKAGVRASPYHDAILLVPLLELDLVDAARCVGEVGADQGGADPSNLVVPFRAGADALPP